MKRLLLVALWWLTLASASANVVRFRFQRRVYIFMEGSGEGQVCVAKTGGNGEDNDLQVQIRGVLQRDQVLLNFENKQTECINVTIMDNEVALEEMKTMTLTLHLPDGQRDTALGHLNETRIIIVDDDELGISLDGDSDVPEDIGRVDICVTFDKAFASEFQLKSFLSQNRSNESPAASPEEDIDITALATNLIVLPGSQRECFSVQVHDDQEPEEKECFVVMIAFAEEPPEMAVIKRDSVTYCIIDNDLVPTSATSMVMRTATPSFVAQRTSATLTPTPTPEVPNAVDRVNEDIDDLNKVLEELEETPLSQNQSEEFASQASDIIEEILSADLTEDDQAALGSSLLMTLDRFALGTLDDGITLIEDDAMNIRLEIREVAPNVATPTTGVAAEGNSIVLPPELFQSTGSASEVRVAAFYYRNLTGVLPNSLPDTDADTVLFSPVLSAALQCGDRRCNTAELDLDCPVRITFSHTRVQENSALCVFWEFTTGSSPSGDVSGRWSREGCTRNDVESESTRTVCECTHLTHFAILLSPRALEISSEDEFALRIIGYVGFSLSLVGLLLTIAAYVFMRSLWNIQSYVLVNLCINLLAAHIIFIAGIERTENKDACSSVAILLHYFFLVAFMWMLMEGIVLYLLLVKVFVQYSTRIAIVVFTILSYGVPAVYMGITIPLGFLISEDGDRYYGTSEACWLDSRSGFVWAFIAPVIVIIVINAGFFIMAIAVIYRHGKRTDTEYSAKTWLRTTVSLVVVMGITWVFGVLVFYESLLVFAYINAIMVAFQGFAIFILFVPLQKRVRDAYRNWWKAPATLGPIITINPSSSTQQKQHSKSLFLDVAGTTSENVYLSYIGSLGKPEEAELKEEVEADLDMVMSTSPEETKEPLGLASTSTFL